MKQKINKDFFLFNEGYTNHEDTTDMARHRWYYYKEGFSPNFVNVAIKTSGITKNDIIIDPFNGSGTTTLAAAIAGYESIGIEVNPFTSFLSSAKLKNVNSNKLKEAAKKVITQCGKGSKSDLVGYSTFSYKKGFEKWLFNRNVLNSFEGGWRFASIQKDKKIEQILKLALISSAMENCNAVKDGKCLRYRTSWKNYGYNIDSFIESFESKMSIIEKDILETAINVKSTILKGDVRKILEKRKLPKFKLCVTSPPYLNTFDYTDIYRPELFLGKFIYDNEELYNLRLKTVRSHVQAKWELPTSCDFGHLYLQTIKHLNDNKDLLMHKDIPLMIHAYFEDMSNILANLKNHAEPNAQLWLVVSNSAYAGFEVPVDLIIADIGARVGWNLKEIGVMRYVKKRKTNYSPNVLELRESVIILENAKS